MLPILDIMVYLKKKHPHVQQLGLLDILFYKEDVSVGLMMRYCVRVSD